MHIPRLGNNARRRSLPVSPWSPADLFAGGEIGDYWDFTDKSTLFQDAAKTTPVTADGQTALAAVGVLNGTTIKNADTTRRMTVFADGIGMGMADTTPTTRSLTSDVFTTIDGTINGTTIYSALTCVQGNNSGVFYFGRVIAPAYNEFANAGFAAGVINSGGDIEADFRYFTPPTPPAYVGDNIQFSVAIVSNGIKSFGYQNGVEFVTNAADITDYDRYNLYMRRDSSLSHQSRCGFYLAIDRDLTPAEIVLLDEYLGI